MRIWATLSLATALTGLICGAAGEASAAALRAVNASDASPQLTEHAVKVVVDNGFARVAVRQVFHNPNPKPIDALYEFPVPPSAALSEMTIESGDHVLHGEVVERDKAQQVYAAQAASGAQAGLATQDGYQRFEFSVANVPSGGDATLSFVYYEPLAIDTNVGRFLYPLENGGTDASSFWNGTDPSPVGTFSFDLDLKSAAPVSEVRVPQVSSARIQRLEADHFSVHFDEQPSKLGTDVVVYYKLQDDLPGKVELVPYRSAKGGPGTFLLLVTPGLDLPELEHGSDFVYVLDFSGSMAAKLDTLKQAVEQAIAQLGPEDRFRLVGFSDSAFDITQGFMSATPENLAIASASLQSFGIQGGTNLYGGLSAGIAGHDPERVTTVFLVTDGVANQGIIEPKSFASMLRESDLRVHGFLLGNSANWPLMQVISESSGGFYAAVSNRDDILGQVQLAKSKLTHESLHDAHLELSGVQVSETTDFDLGKVYRGQQLVVFGRYAAGGTANLSLHTRLANREQLYAAQVSFPDVAEGSPELERLWALDSIHALQKQALLGLLSPAEASRRVQQLGVEYQLVTSETSMLVLDDQGFTDQGIARNNQARSDAEHAAQQNGAGGTGNSIAPINSGPAASPSPPATDSSGDNDTHFGGALDPSTVVLLLTSLLGLGARRRRGSEAT